MSDPFDLRVRRREVLRGGAELGLAGWGVNNGAKGDTQRVVKAKIDGDLSYFNWDGYLDPALIKAFEKRYGVKVRESNFDSMPGMVAKLSGGNRYDVIFPSAEYAQRLIQGKQLLRIDRDQVPNSRSHDFDVDGDRRGGRGPRRDHGHPALASTCARRVRTRSSRIAPEWSD